MTRARIPLFHLILLTGMGARVALAASTALTEKGHYSSFKSSCNEYDVAENLSEALKFRRAVIRRNDQTPGQALGPARDQDGIGYCYSYAGADILEHWLKKTSQMPKEEHVSALALGLRHDERRFDADSTDKTWRSRSVAGEMRATVRMQQRLEPLLVEARRDAKNLEKQLEELRRKKDATPESEKRLRDTIETRIVELTDDLEDRQGEIEKYERSLTPEFLEGGNSRESITRSWPRICFESEVRSDDADIRERYAESIDRYEGLGLHPSSLRNALAFTAQYKHLEAEDGSCRLSVASVLFPGAGFADIEKLATLIGRNDPGRGPFEDLVSAACTDKKLGIPPRFSETRISSELPLEKQNSKVMGEIDRALEKGAVVAVSYRSQLLSGPKLRDGTEDYHASVIVGGASVCGRDYYVLRNSWGPNSCESSRDGFDPGSKKQKIAAVELALELDKCSKAAQQEADRLHPAAGDEARRSREAFLSKRESECRSTYSSSRARQLEVPYFCDGDGNFIVRKDHFKKGAYAATWIDN